MKKVIYSLLALGAVFTMASCSQAAGDDAPAAELSARKSLSVVEGYLHYDAYGTGNKTFKVTTTLLSQGMEFAYDGYTADYSGNGYVLEIEFNSSLPTSLADGTYVADSLRGKDSSGANLWAHKPFTFNPDNTTITYQAGDKTSYTYKDLVVDVQRLDPAKDDYVIVAKAKTVVGPELELTFKGLIKFADVYAYLEPEPASAVENVEFTTAAIAAGSKNEALFAQYYGYEQPYAPQFYELTLTAEDGATATLSLVELVIFSASTTAADCKPYPSSGTYSLSSSSTRQMESGLWDVFNSDGDKYDTTKGYRTRKPYGSYFTPESGVYYYLANASSDSVVIAVNEKGEVTSATGTLTSYNGTRFKFTYPAAKKE